jgi:protease I
MAQNPGKPLQGIRIAILATDGFEQVELTQPMAALREAGADVRLIAPRGGTIRGWNHKQWGDEVKVDLTIDQADPDAFHALVLPGGVMSPDKLRMDERVVEFVRAVALEERPIAAICHGPWILIEIADDALRGVRMTSYRSLRTDLLNAGADWIDEPVVVDGNLITSRSPQDLQLFNRAMIEEFSRQVPSSGRVGR